MQGSGLSMAKTDIPAWTIMGLLIGMISAQIAKPGLGWVGGIVGALMGYVLARRVP